MDILSRRMNVLQQLLMTNCRADCHGLSDLNHYQTMEEACGAPSGRIVRGDERFKR